MEDNSEKLKAFINMLNESKKNKEQVPKSEVKQPIIPQKVEGSKDVLKCFRKQREREVEQELHPEEFPDEYFFSAIAELILDD